jgi:hypothetical protein
MCQSFIFSQNGGKAEKIHNTSKEYCAIMEIGKLLGKIFLVQLSLQ